ncbi:MAG: hypothetical protein ACRDX8_00590 [Acidimicrobiales bacterium]
MADAETVELALESALRHRWTSVGLLRQRLKVLGWRPGAGQHEVSADGRRYRADFAWPDPGVLVELEGYAQHGTPADHRRTCVARTPYCSPDRVGPSFVTGGTTSSGTQLR